jgi:hypothetical protein
LPLDCDPKQIAQLNAPGAAIRRYQKFMTHAQTSFLCPAGDDAGDASIKLQQSLELSGKSNALQPAI